MQVSVNVGTEHGPVEYDRSPWSLLAGNFKCEVPSVTGSRQVHRQFARICSLRTPINKIVDNQEFELRVLHGECSK